VIMTAYLQCRAIDVGEIYDLPIKKWRF